MEEQKTLEQIEQLKTWAAERDAILSDISVNRVENDRLLVINKQLSQTNSEITARINQSEGRITELSKKENELIDFTNSELASLSIKKSQLQGEVIGLENQINLLIPQKQLIEDTIKSLTDAHDRVFDRVSVLDKVVDHVVKVNAKNLDDINYFVKNLVDKTSGIAGMIDSLSAIHDKAANRIIYLDRATERIIAANSKNLEDISELIKK